MNPVHLLNQLNPGYAALPAISSSLRINALNAL